MIRIDDVSKISAAVMDDGLRGSPVVGEFAFGGVYTAYTPFDRFAEASEALGMNVIRWPGGTLAETRPDRYSLEYENLQIDGPDRPGVRELMAYGVEHDLGVSIILPTHQYKDDPDAGAAALDAFMGRLVSGAYGEIPENFTLEIGNEYYAHYEDASQYGAVANGMLNVINKRLDAAPEGFPRINIGMQVGRTPADDEAIRDELTPDAFSVVTHLRAHRLSPGLEKSSNQVEILEGTRDLWDKEVRDAGGEEPEFYLSAWNVADWTRATAREDYAKAYETHFGERAEITDEMDKGRLDKGFETYWQDGTLTGPAGQTVRTGSGLLNRDYGPEKEAHIMELFTSYALKGMDMSAVYGVDTGYPSDMADVVGSGKDAKLNMFSGSGAYRLLSEMVGGMSPVDLERDNRDAEKIPNDVNRWMYADDGKIVLYMSSGELDGPLKVDLDLGPDVLAAWGDKVVRTPDANWAEDYGIPVRGDVNHAPEAEMYEKVDVEGFRPDVKGDNLSYTFTEDNQLVRFTFALNTQTLNDLTEMMRGEPVLTGPPDGEEQPQPPGPTDPGSPEEPDDEDEEDESSGGGGGGCFVATAAYGGPDHPEVAAMRHLRDDRLMRHPLGRAFVRVYWSVGPHLAARVRPGGVTGRAVRAIVAGIVRRSV